MLNRLRSSSIWQDAVAEYDHVPNDDPDPVVHRDEPTIVPVLYYDPARFPTTRDRKKVEAIVQLLRPELADCFWYVLPLPAQALIRDSPFLDRQVEDRFLANGFAFDVEAMAFSNGRPAQSVKHSQAQDALEYLAAVADMVIGIVGQMLGQNCPKWLSLPPPQVLAPILGRGNILHSHGEKGVEKRDVPLVLHERILMGCANFSAHRELIGAPAFMPDVSIKKGRERFTANCSTDLEEFERLVRADVEFRFQTSSSFELAGVALWACQTVGRVRATLGAAQLSSTPAWRRNEDRGKRLTKFKTKYLTEAARVGDCHSNGFKDPTVLPALPNNFLRSAATAFHRGSLISADDPFDEERADIEALAAWAGHLRRWGFAFFDPATAGALLRIIEHDYQGFHSYSEIYRADAHRFIAEQLGSSLTSDLITSANRIVKSRDSIPVVYEWNDFPGNMPFKQQKDVLRGNGMFLPITATEIRFFSEAARKLGEDGLFLR